MLKEAKLIPIQEMYCLTRKQNKDTNLLDQELYELYCKSFDKTRFENAITSLCKLHKTLLSTIDYEKNIQILTDGKIAVEYFDLGASYEASKEKISKFKEEVVLENCKINRILKRVMVLLDSEGGATILTLTDGIGIDGQSMENMLASLVSLYEGETLEEPYPFFDFANEYVDKVEENRPNVINYWEKEERIEGFELSKNLTKGEARLTQLKLKLDKEYLDKLKLIASNSQLSSYALNLAIYIKLLERYTNQKEFALSLPRSIRDYEHENIDNSVGMLTDFVPFLYRKRESSILELANYIQDFLWEIMDLEANTGMDALKVLQSKLDKQLSLKWSFTEVNKKEFSSKNFFRKSVNVNTASTNGEMLLLDSSDGLDIIFVIREDLINIELAKGLVENYKHFLESVSLNKIDIKEENFSYELMEEEIIDKINATSKELKNLSLKALIKESVRDNEAKIALYYKGENLSYGELDKRAKKLSSLILRKINKGKLEGISKERVAILMNKSSEQIITALAAIYANLSYMPIEISLPVEDINYCLLNSEIKLVICDKDNEEKTAALNCEYLCFDEQGEDKEELEAINSLEISGYKDGVAVIINTSGTTGKPKSVLIGEDGLVNALLASKEAFKLEELDYIRAIAVTNFCHDMSMFDYLGMFVLGGSMVIPEQARVKNPNYLMELIKDKKVNIWNSVPAIFEMLLYTNEDNKASFLESLRRVILGGDWVRVATVNEIQKLNEKTYIYSVGGPTETTLWNIFHKVEKEDLENGFIPYGKPIWNTSYYLLDDNYKESPIGVVARIYVEGIGVTKGYASNIEESNKHYIWIKHKDGKAKEAKPKLMFKSGDLALRLKDGSIRFVGRDDNQVKINGKRIELAGIERKCNEIEGVKINCCVVNNSSKKLVLFYEGDIKESSLRDKLEASLVSYMMPGKIVKLDKIPLSHNGKADRKLLSNYEFKQEQQVIKDESLESNLVAILQEVLGAEGINIEDNYYYLGGDSINAMQIISMLFHKYKVELDIYDILGNPEIKDWIPIIEEKIRKKNENEDLLNLCKRFFNNDKLDREMSFTQMGGNETNLRAFSKKLGLSEFQILSLPWIDCWEKKLGKEV